MGYGSYERFICRWMMLDGFPSTGQEFQDLKRIAWPRDMANSHTMVVFKTIHHKKHVKDGRTVGIVVNMSQLSQWASQAIPSPENNCLVYVGV